MNYGITKLVKSFRIYLWRSAFYKFAVFRIFENRSIRQTLYKTNYGSFFIPRYKIQHLSAELCVCEVRIMAQPPYLSLVNEERKVLNYAIIVDTGSKVICLLCTSS